MWLPESIQVGAHRIAIVRRRLDEEDAYGVFDSEKLTIFLDSSLTGSILAETFFHELTECLNFFVMDGEMDHKSISTFGLLLAQSLGDILGGFE